jgi:hypothetical protein
MTMYRFHFSFSLLSPRKPPPADRQIFSSEPCICWSPIAVSHSLWELSKLVGLTCHGSHSQAINQFYSDILQAMYCTYGWHICTRNIQITKKACLLIARWEVYAPLLSEHLSWIDSSVHIVLDFSYCSRSSMWDCGATRNHIYISLVRLLSSRWFKFTHHVLDLVQQVLTGYELIGIYMPDMQLWWHSVSDGFERQGQDFFHIDLRSVLIMTMI